MFPLQFPLHKDRLVDVGLKHHLTFVQGRQCCIIGLGHHLSLCCEKTEEMKCCEMWSQFYLLEKVKRLELQAKVSSLSCKKNSIYGAKVLFLPERYSYKRKTGLAI